MVDYYYYRKGATVIHVQKGSGPNNKKHDNY